MIGWKGLNWVEHVLLLKFVLVGHQHTRPQEQLKSFFSAGIQQLIERYNKCIVLQGDYVQKWYVKLLTVTSIKAVIYILLLLFDSPSYLRYLPNVPYLWHIAPQKSL